MSSERAGSCRVCGGGIAPFMSFGAMPIANGFLAADEIPSEYFFDLAPAACGQCGTFQLVEQPPPARMFHDEYAFFSSSSLRMQEHFKAFASDVRDRVLFGRPDPFVVEIGSNDGVLLRHIREAGYRHLGVEASANVNAVARARGVETIEGFFDQALARQIRDQHGPVDAVLAANVLCHLADIHDVAAGIAHLLAPDGVLMFEDPYLGDVIAKTAYDQIYDEHVFLFSAASVRRAFVPHGLQLVDVMPQPTHGGSMRYLLARGGTQPIGPRVAALLESERQQGLHEPATYDRFRRNCEDSREDLRRLLAMVRREGKRVVGYGATSKSATVTNYCQIGAGDVEFIADTTPIKQGKLSPGMHIPVRPHEEFSRNPPDYALLFAWNHAAEIFAKEQRFSAAGGKWISFVPRVEVLG